MIPEYSGTHLVLIPSYNTGAQRLVRTVIEATSFWQPVWVIIDGSTDGSGEELKELGSKLPGLRVIELPMNVGKGAAVLKGMHEAKAAGFQYVLVMDADGQHPANEIQSFMLLSDRNRAAMILGVPDFGADAPLSRRYGRRVGNFWAQFETLWGGIHDSLFGFRVYPIEQSIRVLEEASFGKRYDFDTFLAVRLYWAGVKPLNIKVPVKYFSGGVSHFRYWRDNFLLFKLHLFLLACMLTKISSLVRLRSNQAMRSTHQEIDLSLQD